ncbi:MAG: hypothetical protein BYD32DRAFT_419449 [Podila humilis]|nr:MAG: hypothetical protein BYD32DRAFT_419449 [Podila humilis]
MLNRHLRHHTYCMSTLHHSLIPPNKPGHHAVPLPVNTMPMCLNIHSGVTNKQCREY